MNTSEFHFWGHEISHEGHKSPDLSKLVQASDSAAQPDLLTPRYSPSDGSIRSRSRLGGALKHCLTIFSFFRER